jgi:hypothetical protein
VVFHALPVPIGQNIVKTVQGKYINGKKEKAREGTDTMWTIRALQSLLLQGFTATVPGVEV